MSEEELQSPSLDLNERLQSLYARVQEDLSSLDEVMEELKILARENAALHQISLARLRLLAAAGKHENALAYASKMIPLLFQAGFDKLALLAYRFLGKEGIKLELDSENHKKLGRVLRENKDFRGAAWNYCRAEELDQGDHESSSRICLQIAAEAEQAGKPSEALAIYRFFLTKYPDSPMLDFIKSSMEFQEMKIQRQIEESALGCIESEKQQLPEAKPADE